MKYWILKTEPNAYSFEDLVRDKTTVWDGVRNYQARNNLKLMTAGDKLLIYHSVGPKDIVGSAEVSKEAFPDPKDDKWIAVEIKPDKEFRKPVNLSELKAEPKLKDLTLIKQSRLSVCPISKLEWDTILKMQEP